MPDKIHHTHFTIGEQKWKVLEARKQRRKLILSYFLVWLAGVALPLIVIGILEAIR